MAKRAIYFHLFAKASAITMTTSAPSSTRRGDVVRVHEPDGPVKLTIGSGAHADRRMTDMSQRYHDPSSSCKSLDDIPNL
jgi:hypothetical protein